LVSARIAKRIRALGLAGERDYLRYLESGRSADELVEFLDVISTNFTRFFRESDHFELLGAAVKERTAQGRRRLRFWSAACSSGEEPYSMAITINESVGSRKVDARILATDISGCALGRARAGVYSQEAVESVGPQHRARYFNKKRKSTLVQPEYEVKAALKEKIVFKRLNLAAPPFPMQGPLDAVFCRNVLIYFDKQVRQRLLGGIEPLLAPGGLLIIGHAESLSGLSTRLQLLRPSVYRMPVEDR